MNMSKFALLVVIFLAVLAIMLALFGISMIETLVGVLVLCAAGVLGIIAVIIMRLSW